MEVTKIVLLISYGPVKRTVAMTSIRIKLTRHGRPISLLASDYTSGISYDRYFEKFLALSKVTVFREEVIGYCAVEIFAMPDWVP